MLIPTYKICTSSKVIPGCGKVKPLSAFNNTRGGGKMPACDNCVSNYYVERQKPRAENVKGTAETDLYNQFNVKW